MARPGNLVRGLATRIKGAWRKWRGHEPKPTTQVSGKKGAKKMRKGYPEEKKTEVRKLREQGFSYAQISDAAGVSVNTVIKWLKGSTGPDKALKALKALKAPKAPAAVKATASKKNTNSAEACCRVPSTVQLKKLVVLKEKLLKLASKLVQAAEKIN